ncbi:MAG TPA: RusA family crossover junction endodeoxyribonuclease [Candidatus Wunengus sp. YC61]|uniref:RusA family crossover junction endodeoxyribonuclease n=1 Tax=Candidatus Wunengus sp. YC61 TaxID=3367698 RepID=UPI004027610B
MMPEILMTIPGKPIGKARPRFFRRGKFVGTYNCQETEEGRFKWELLRQILPHRKSEAPLADKGIPVKLYLTFFMPIPESISKKKRELYIECSVPHTKTPDLDNLVKFVKDCATGLLWKDDSQVISLTASKSYHPSPATEIRVEFGSDGWQEYGKINHTSAPGARVNRLKSEDI